MKRLLLIIATLSTLSAHAQLDKNYFFWSSERMLAREKYEDAVETLDLLLSVDGSLVEAYYLRGVAKFNLDDMQGAERDFSEAITRNPVYTMAYSSRAVTLARQKRYAEALKDFDMALELRPDITGTYYNRGLTRLHNSDYRGALTDLDYYIRRETASAEAHLLRGQALLGLQDTLAAAAEFEFSIKANSRAPEGYYRRGLLAAEQHRWDDALVDMTAALARDSTFAAAHAVRAGIHRHLGNYAAAEADFRIADYLTRDPATQAPDPENTLAETYKTLKIY